MAGRDTGGRPRSEMTFNDIGMPRARRGLRNQKDDQ
jgi:hypothetical protein